MYSLVIINLMKLFDNVVVYFLFIIFNKVVSKNCVLFLKNFYGGENAKKKKNTAQANLIT